MKLGPDETAYIGASDHNNSIVTLNSAETVGRVLFGRGGTGSSLTVESGGSLTLTRSGKYNRLGHTSAITVNLNDGAITCASSKVTTDGGSTFNISGGTFSADDYEIGKVSAADLKVIGSSATINIADKTEFGADSSTTFDFNGGSEVSTWNTERIEIDAGAKLSVVGASALGVGTYDLISYKKESKASASFTEGSITGLAGGLSGSFSSDADSIYLTVVAVP